MGELGLRARSLFRAGRAALLPTEADRTRVSLALRTRFGIPSELLPHEVDGESVTSWTDDDASAGTALRRTS